MTLPDERYRSLVNTRNFLVDLVQPKTTPRVPRYVRQQALSLLKHFPNLFDVEQLCDKLPDQYAKELEPVERMFLKYQLEKENNNA